MSLEQALKDQTEAIKAQTIALNHVVAALGKHINTMTPSSKEDKPKAKKEEILDLDDFEDITNDVPALPEGERNDAYFAKYVRPVLKILSETNRPSLLKLLEHFKAPKASDIKAEDWDEAVHMAAQG